MKAYPSSTAPVIFFSGGNGDLPTLSQINPPCISFSQGVSQPTSSNSSLKSQPRAFCKAVTLTKTSPRQNRRACSLIGGNPTRLGYEQCPYQKHKENATTICHGTQALSYSGHPLATLALVIALSLKDL